MTTGPISGFSKEDPHGRLDMAGISPLPVILSIYLFPKFLTGKSNGSVHCRSAIHALHNPVCRNIC